MRTLFVTRPRFYLLSFLVTLCFAGGGFRLWQLHVGKAPYYRQMAMDMRRDNREIKANRGTVIDSRGTKLATTQEVWDIGVDAHEDKAAEEVARADEIAAVLKISPASVRSAFVKEYITAKDENTAQNPDGKGDPKPRRWKKIADGVPEETVRKLEALKLKSVYGAHRFVRDYPQGRLAAHLVGYVNKEGTPAMGIEKAMNFFLDGENGWRESQRDGRKREQVHLRTRSVDPVDGLSVELTIDALIQNICEQELERAAAEFSPESIVAIVTRAATGEILALANWPTFDLRKYSDPAASPLSAQRNRAVTDVYEPGSVFKIVGISAGLNENFITPNSVFRCDSGEDFYNGKRVSLPKEDHPIREQPAPIWKIVQKSSNRGTVVEVLRFCEKFGEQKFYDYACNFGFGNRTGLITGTEQPGIMLQPKNWNRGEKGTITRMPMGHSVSVTAMQMHYAMSAIANDGKLMAPMLVKRIWNRLPDPIDPEGSPYLTFLPQERARPITPKAAEAMRNMLRAVCRKEGTATRAEIPGYDVAGKTGTTQKLIEITDAKGAKKFVYTDRQHIASFSGFFPAGKPQYVITVITDNPQARGVGYGGLYAAPLFANIAKNIIKETGMPPAEPAPFDGKKH